MGWEMIFLYIVLALLIMFGIGAVWGLIETRVSKEDMEKYKLAKEEERTKRWKEQEQADKIFLENNPEIKNQMLTAYQN